jgi:tRNA G46 methylase TrmB
MMIQRWNLHTLLIATLRLRSCASFHHTSLHRSSTSNTRTRTHTRTYTTRTFNPLKPIRITTFESNNDSVLVEKEKENEKNDLDNQYDNQYEYWKNQHSQKTISNILVCGDGDLSYSANIAQSLHEKNINLIATVLEEQNVHCEIYQHSTTNHQKIKSYKNNNNNKNNHEVKYGIDATKLEENFPNTTFDRIQFNFPHWRGKANHKYNRQLIDSFLKSASLVLAKNGEIHIALCEGQGGSNANNLQEYRDTWTPAFFASSHGLLLFDVLPFAVSYNLSSHRGVDRGFKIGKAPEMVRTYTLTLILILTKT